MWCPWGGLRGITMTPMAARWPISTRPCRWVCGSLTPPWGGLGGCPYAPGSAGNVATEAVNAHLLALGYKTGIDQAIVQEAAAMAQAMRGPVDA